MLSSGLNRAGSRLKKINKKIVVVAVAGGSCSGKTVFSSMLCKKYSAAILNMDDYYKGGSPDSNFDVPKALDLTLLRKHLADLSKGKTIRKPIYDFTTHRRKGYVKFSPSRIIILEGLFALHRSLRSDLKIFVLSSAKNRTERRLKRDMTERGRTKESILTQLKVVNKMYIKHVLPTKKYADIIVRN